MSQLGPSSISTRPINITAAIRAIVCFGPPTVATGCKAGDYLQVVIDPDMASPDGAYIRFDQRQPEDENEIHGWQRINALTICEVLDDSVRASNSSITMSAIAKE